MFEAIRGLLDTHDALAAADPTDRRRLAFLILAATVARTPDVPLPATAAGGYGLTAGATG